MYNEVIGTFNACVFGHLWPARGVADNGFYGIASAGSLRFLTAGSILWFFENMCGKRPIVKVRAVRP